MGVSRSGYYKWRDRGKPAYEDKRTQVLALVEEIHAQHPSHGYRWVAAFIRINRNVKFSDNYVYKAFRYLGIQSETKHKDRPRPRKVKDKYPNLIYTTWETVDRPRQVVVSDMTAIKTWWVYVEVTFYFDVFTKQILTWKVADRRGDRFQYIGGLKEVILILKDNQEPTILHTDQGSVYASVAYNELIQETCIKRSMSRAGKPTDNPVNESLNGWIKEELFTDFSIDHCRDRETLVAVLSRYVEYYNKQRPCFAIGYDTPDNYYRRFKRGEIPKKDTFSKRVLTEEPKFVRKRKVKKEETVESTAVLDDVSTSEKEKD